MSPSPSDSLNLDGGVAELPGWALIEVTGRHRERFLSSQVTSDVGGLAVGESQLSALLDRSGRLQAFFFLHKRPEAVDLLIPETAARTCVDRLEDHIIADDVAIGRRDVGLMRLVLGPAAVAMEDELDEESRMPVTGWGSRGFVTWIDHEIALEGIDAAELETFRVLGGPPAWGRDARENQLVNETSLLDTAVSFDKGCYLGQETVAKVASHRGAVRAPVLLEVEGDRTDPDDLVGLGFSVGDRTRAGEVLSAVRWEGSTWFQVSLHRELRVIGRGVRCVFSNGAQVQGTIRALPLLSPPSREEMADRLTVAASAAFGSDDPDRALELLSRTIVVCPTWADAYESMGVILGRLGRHHEAIESMHSLLEIDSSSVMAHSNLSLFHNQLGDIEKAEHHLGLATRASMTTTRDTDQGSTNEADAIEADRRRREEMFRQVLEIDPDDALAHFGMGELAVEAGRHADAVDHLEMAIENDPGHSAAMLALGAALEGLEDGGSAQDIYERGIEIAAKKGDLATAQKMQDRLNALRR